MHLKKQLPGDTLAACLLRCPEIIVDHHRRWPFPCSEKNRNRLDRIIGSDTGILIQVHGPVSSIAPGQTVLSQPGSPEVGTGQKMGHAGQRRSVALRNWSWIIIPSWSS